MTDPILLAGYDKQLHKCVLKKGEPKELTIGSDLKDSLTFSSINETLSIYWDGAECQLENQRLSSGELTLDLGGETLRLYLSNLNDKTVFDISASNTVTIGKHKNDDIQLHQTEMDMVLLKEGQKECMSLYINNGDAYHNYQLIERKMQLDTGDIIFFDGVMMEIGKGEIAIIAEKGELKSSSLTMLYSQETYSEDYPDFHRSPRIIHREPEEKRVIAKPTPQPSKPSEQIVRTIVPPLVMIAAFTLVTIFQPRGIYIVVMLAMTVTTVVIAVIYYFKNAKQYKIDVKERIKDYKAYLERKTKELYDTTEEQRHALFYHYPDVTEIKEMAMEVNARTYEKTIYHHDFLMYRAGLGTVDTSFEIELNQEEFTQEKDELMNDAKKLHEQFKELDNVPITASLMKGPVGYIGNRKLVLEQLQLAMMQIAYFHSYHEVQSIVVFPEKEIQEWQWMRWLPHASLKELNVRGFVYNERSRDQVLNSLYQILKERKLKLNETESSKKEGLLFVPHYLVFITDEQIILDHTIMEFFNEDPSELGVSVVFVQEVLPSLPEHVQTVIDIKDASKGNVLLEEGELVNQSFVPDHFPQGFNKEAISRSLAPLNHLQSLKSSIPESVTFLEMYGIERVDELNLTVNWRQNETYKSLAVPLGLRAKDDIVYLNLHEKAHGPHGLVAGTTGSGKSEIIQSYILSLAVHFHPYEVAFLLIDYKGGGMANLFKHLPHLLGTITNLDGAQSLRALASIKAELKRRQKLFGDHDVNHINQYQKLFKQGEAKEPMPHLFLISDEFAELKAEQPDFMKELVSTARIGRSLGIHLILATQKPSGVVDDQIWSNSKFKLALKVQNESDSNEILKTPDAAKIMLPGRSYLQVGNNEIYELFQSAWSGAEYHPDKDDLQAVDTTIYEINELGQYAILTKDLSGLAHQEDIEKTVTELDAVIDYIHDYTEEEKIEKLPSPWLPPLEERIFAPELVTREFKEAWAADKVPLEPLVGLADYPDEQAQKALYLPMTKDGHVAVFASPGYGKSTFLQTLIMDMARVHNPEELHVYLLDFGTNGLLPLKGLPHAADTMLVDESEKIGKFIRRMDAAIKERKKLLSAFGVATMDMYEKASGKIIPNIVIVIDNYDAVREAVFQETFEKTITQIAREGSSIGIHLMVSGSRQNVLRMQLLSNIKIQIALYLIDELEARSIVGRTKLKVEEINGRGLIKIEEAAAFQTALPVQGEDTLEIIEAIQKEANEMDQYWEGERPLEIPMMPEDVIDFAKFKENKATQKLVEQKILPLGLEFENVTPLPFDFKRMGNLVAVGDRLDRVERLQRGLAKNISLLSNEYKTMLLDTADQKLARIGDDFNAYISKPEQLSSLKNDLVAEIKARNEEGVVEPGWVIMIADFKDFNKNSMISDDEIAALINAGNVGIHLVICSEYSYLGQSYEQVPKYVRSQVLSGIVAMRLGDQDMFKQRFISNEPVLNAYECYYAMDHQYTKLKIPE